MTGSEEPHPDDILTLGALSQPPDDNATSLSGFDFVSGITNIVVSASSTILNAASKNDIFPGLAVARLEPTVGAQIAGRASEIADSNPPVWYLNFPLEINPSVREDLRDRAQTMLDFKCWVSMKWWSAVFQAIPTENDPFNKLQQSTAFVQVAMQDLPQTPWLQSFEEPRVTKEVITCPFSDLHAEIINLAMRNFHSLDEQSRNAIEPVLKGIVRSASQSTVSYSDQKMVIAEKHEYCGGDIISSLRQICFSIGESFYDVQTGKDSSRRYVRCEVSFVQYEGVFNPLLWMEFTLNINGDSKKACEDFIRNQTINVPVSDDDAYEIFQPSAPFYDEHGRMARMMEREKLRAWRAISDISIDIPV